MKLKLIDKIVSKSSNLSFSYFEADFFKLIDLAGKVGNSISVLVYNSSIITDFNSEKAGILKK